MEIVWKVGEKRSAWAEFAEAVAALRYHYARCLFGAAYKMG